MLLKVPARNLDGRTLYAVYGGSLADRATSHRTDARPRDVDNGSFSVITVHHTRTCFHILGSNHPELSEALFTEPRKSNFHFSCSSPHPVAHHQFLVQSNKLLRQRKDLLPSPFCKIPQKRKAHRVQKCHVDHPKRPPPKDNCGFRPL